jgi:hypothetical protein
MKISEDIWKAIQKHLNYTDEEMKIFRTNPRNEDVLSKTDLMLNKTIVAEVIESRGCDSGHKPGDKFYFDGRGVSLLTNWDRAEFVFSPCIRSLWPCLR